MFIFIVESKCKRIIHLLLVVSDIYCIYTVISSHISVEQSNQDIEIGLNLNLLLL